jgi:carbon monoxide dehydrogenase subunit G
VDEDRYETRITIGVAAIKGTYDGKIQLVEKEQPTSYKLLLEGSGSPGFVQGSGSFRFEP